MELTDRDRNIYLARLAGADVTDIASEHRLSRAQVHRVIARVRDSGQVVAMVGVDSKSVGGPFTPSEIATAVRTYAQRLGISVQEPRLSPVHSEENTP